MNKILAFLRSPEMKLFLKRLGHAAAGAGLAAAAATSVDFIPLIPHIDPTLAAIIGSAISSYISGRMKPPR